MASLQEVKEFIKKSVDWLKEEDMGCTTLKLDDKLAICVGWLPGYGEEARDDVIQSASEPDFAINAGLKVWTSDDMRTDYEFINMPYYESGEVVETDVSIEPSDEEDGYEQIAKWLLDSYEGIKDLDIDDNGLIHEDEDAIVTDREEVLTDKEKPNYVKEESLKEDVDLRPLDGEEVSYIFSYVVALPKNEYKSFKNKEEAIKFAKENNGNLVREFTYTTPDEDGFVELVKEFNIWTKEEESLKEEKEDAKSDVEQYKQAWNIVLDDFKDAYYRLVGLMGTAGFDCNEFINTKKAREAMDNSFAKKSLDELEILDWCEEVKDNINKWTPGEWLEEACKEVEKKQIKESWDGDSIIEDLTERAQSMLNDREYGDMDECVQQAIDEGLIYTDDIYTLAQHYGSIDDSTLIESFYDDLYYDILNGLEEPEDDEDSTLDWEEDEEEEVEESLKEEKLSNGERIAKIVAKEFEGQVGPFGGENPYLNDNEVTLHAQGGEDTFRFNDDGTIDFVNVEEAVNEWAANGDIDEDDIEDCIKEYGHYNSIRDLVNSGVTWFSYFSDEAIKKIEDILGVYSK